MAFHIGSRAVPAILAGFVLLGAIPVEGQVVLDAAPIASVLATPEMSQREDLAEKVREEARVVILKQGDRYVWGTRGGGTLVYVPPQTPTAIMHFFIDPGGAGYVKVLDQRGIPEDSILRTAGGDIQFFEHVSSGMMTVTYWGEAAEFNP
jgi:hypothetical protein